MRLNVPITVQVILMAERTNAHADRDHDVMYLGTKSSVVEAKRHAEQVTGYDEWVWRWINGKCFGFHGTDARAIWIVEEEL